MRLPLLATALALAACAGPRYSGPALPQGLGGGPESRCQAGGPGALNPLLTEWSAPEKANLESLLGGGAVAVEYRGCEMRVLTRCRLPGRYGWLRTSPAGETVQIDDEDQLFAKLPLGAISLEGELKRSGKLTVHTQVAGQFRLEGAAPEGVPADGECARATHLVGGLAVGAYSMAGSGTAGGKAELGLPKLGASAGGKVDRTAGVARSAGDWQSCAETGDAMPHARCRSPIQAFLWRIPGRAEEETPAGMVRVDLVATNPSTRWDVYYDDEVICSTPCTRFLDPSRPLLLRARDRGYGGRPDAVVVPDLEAWAGRGGVQVAARPTSHGKMATGIVFTTFGGMAVVTGITLTSIGCAGSDRSTGMCTAGLISLVAGGAVTAGSISLIVDSLPKAEIRGGNGTPWMSVAVGPGFVTGRF